MFFPVSRTDFFLLISSLLLPVGDGTIFKYWYETRSVRLAQPFFVSKIAFLSSQFEAKEKSAERLIDIFDPRNVFFFLYTRKNKDVPEGLVVSNSRLLKNSKYLDPKKETKIFIHGYVDSPNKPIFLAIKDAYLRAGDYNVILVDWSIYAGVINYFRAARKSKLVGQLVGRFVDLTKLQKVHIIGHSLGAHAAGFAGKTSKRNINRITGLDPAGPAFHHTKNMPEERLDKNDAQFTDVIYTNAGKEDGLHFGLDFSVGHANFYVNGGGSQPECRFIINLIGKLVKYKMVICVKSPFYPV
ncbi:hypothetical protein QYM36_014733 [Artemia franciscana]|uniref:Lipase domain-containing protein n=1 Tax=Artemia franciscana TaxID=6661 RepID=A0AA88H8D5_ARTSF|nr:hypothetical protein QYM36_014733 [Artemia franciscana]